MSNSSGPSSKATYAAAAAQASASSSAAPPATAAPPAAAAAAAASSSSSGSKLSHKERFEFTRQPGHYAGDDVYLQPLEPELAAKVSIPFSSFASLRGTSSTGNDDTGGDHAVHNRLRAVLNQFGFAIVTDVLSRDDVTKMEQLFGEDLLSLIVPPKNDKEKQAQEQSAFLKSLKQDPDRRSVAYKWPMEKLPLGTKFASDQGIPHGKCAWQCRTHPNVAKVFASIFGTTELCVGCDNVFFDNRLDMEEHDTDRRSALWPHTDQNKYARGGDHECVQGVLYLWPADTETSATVVWPGSNGKVYDDLMSRSTKDWSKAGHFCRIPKSWHQRFVAEARRVTAMPPGSLLLWSSKTTHQGYALGPRLAIPICMEPKILRDPGAYNSKLQLIKEGQPSTHWATLAVNHRFGQAAPPRTHPDDPAVTIGQRAHLHLLDPTNPKRLALPEAVENLL